MDRILAKKLGRPRGRKDSKPNRRTCTCTCVACGAIETVRGSGGKFRCQACRLAGRYGPVAPADPTGAAEARAMVNQAVRAGRMPRPSEFLCADCGAGARHYDHRDYSKPLDVVAVCHSCNLKRGPGKPSISAMISGLCARPDAYIGRRKWTMLTPDEIAGLDLCGLLEFQGVSR